MAQTPVASRHFVPPAEQAARDNDRVEILRQELKKSEALLETLARRKAERRAAADVESANEIEEQHGRTLSDIAGLRRELATATGTAAPAPAVAGAAVTTKAAPATPPSRIAKAPPPAPWWDVYSKARGAQPPTAMSSSVSTPASFAPAEAGARSLPARRPE